MDDVIVIGGGAAGMMAALTAAKKGCRVRLLEKNEKLGKKLYITGKGRCNLTNGADMEDVLNHVVSNRKFLYSAFYGFSNRDMMELLERAGLPLKTERGNRVFPASDKSSDVIRTLQRLLQEAGVRICLGCQADAVLTEGSVCTGVRLTDGRFYPAGQVIVATGGLSYPSTGSTGDGYRFASACGHKVTELSPALVPFCAEEDWIGRLQGLSLKNVSVKLSQGKKVYYEEFGEMLFTHFGVSGPAVLSGSSVTARYLKKGPLTLTIDLKPALTEEQLDQRLVRDFAALRNKQFKNALQGLLPAKLIPVTVEQSGIDPEKQVNAITRKERERLVRLIKHFTLTLTGLRDYHEAIITQGGISVKEIDPATMESKLVKGLFFAGEVLDVDAMTGGYNLQIAWSTGYAAGSHCRAAVFD